MNIQGINTKKVSEELEKFKMNIAVCSDTKNKGEGNFVKKYIIL